MIMARKTNVKINGYDYFEINAVVGKKPIIKIALSGGP